MTRTSAAMEVPAPAPIRPLQRNSGVAAFRAVVACGLFMAIFAAAGWTAWLGKSPTFDEPLHLVSAWMQTHYFDFRCNPEDPPLWKYYVAMGTRAESMTLDRQSVVWKGLLDTMITQGLYVPDTMYRTPGNDANVLIRAGRTRMIGLALVLSLLIAWWAWRLGGPVAAAVAVAAFCLDPNFLAHGPLIKNDVPISLAFFALMAALWLLGERATIVRFIAVGLLLGAALTIKFSGVLALLMVATTLACRALIPQPWRAFRGVAATRPQRMLVAATIVIGAFAAGYLSIWACYGFRFGPSPNPNELFGTADIIRISREKESFAAHGGPIATDTATFQKWEAEWKPSLAVRAFSWGNAHRVLPQPWLLGFLFTYATSRVRPTFLLGHRGMLGWWYYFPLAMLFKTPLATLVALAVAAALAYWLLWKRAAGARAPNPSTPRDLWPFWAAAIAPAIYMLSAVTSHIDMGIRHVLPIYPFLFIFLGVTASQAWRRRPRVTLAAVVVFILGLGLETYHAYPNFIPFFNVAAGGARGGRYLLSDSNIDWGQELIDLAQWQQKHPDRQLFLCYFGSADPRYYGLRYVKLPGGTSEADEATPSSLPPAYAISVTTLQSTYLLGDTDEYYNRFRTQTPVEILGGSIYVFEPPR